MNNDKNAFTTYLNEIGKEKILTPEEEKELADRIKNGDSKALEKLTQANLTFVVSVAKQYKDRGLDMEDLVSEGNIGMMKAAAHFQGDKGKRFVSYAAPYIRSAIEEAINQQSLLYRIPSDSTNAARDKRIGKPLSIDAPVGGSQDLSLGRVIPDSNAPDPDDVLNKQLIVEQLDPLIAQLKGRERQVLLRYYGVGVEQKNMAEIATEMGLKRERVRQIRDKAVRKIAKMTKDSQLKSYLRK
ncbi:MAG: sigma-70 family RNA polymerase sigma factor [Prevotella sp.]